MTMLIVFTLIYLVGMPIIFLLIPFLHKKFIIEKAIERAGRSKTDQEKIPKPLGDKWRKRISFTLKDKRTFAKKDGKSATKITRQQTFFVIYGIGLVLSIVAGFLTNWQMLIIGCIFFFISMGFAIKSSNKIINKRNEIIQRMFKIGQPRLGFPIEDAKNPEKDVRILQWEEYIRPTKIEFFVSDNFSESGTEGFLRQFNQIFGTETAWVPDYNEKTGASGWNFAEGKVTLHSVPPLPEKTIPFDAHYVNNPAISWSFFPVGIGVEHGVELKNEKTGEVEHVIGFDLSGTEKKVGESHGAKVAPNIAVASPMVLVAGRTGGGKSLSSDTLVEVVGHKDLEEE